METQRELFDEAEGFLAVLKELVRQLGGPKRVGPMLRGDALPVTQAAQWVRDCLNPDRRERFDPDQVLHLLREARRVGCHEGMHFLAAECGYQRPEPIEPEDAANKLKRQFVDAVGVLRDITREMERAGLPLPRT